MFCEIINGSITQTVQDTDPVRAADGTQYPGNWPKSTIPNFVAVALAAVPNAALEVVTGSSIALVGGVPVQTLSTVPVTLAAAQTAAVARLNAAAQMALAAVVAAYPDLEAATWGQQYAEAVAVTANPSVGAPLLSAIAAASGQPVQALIVTVLTRAQAYHAAVGELIGKRLALTAQIYATATAADAVAINW